MTYTEQGPFIDVPFAQWNSPPVGAKPITADAANAFDQGIKDAHDLIAAGPAPTLSNIPAGSTLTVQKDSATGFWPSGWNADGTPIYTGGSSSAGVRPSPRADLYFQWKGADPSPAIVTSGTGGMRDGIDTRFVTP